VLPSFLAVRELLADRLISAAVRIWRRSAETPLRRERRAVDYYIGSRRHARLEPQSATDAGDEFRGENVKLLIGSDDDERFSTFRHQQRIMVGNLETLAVRRADGERLERRGVANFLDRLDGHGRRNLQYRNGVFKC
jgi:hypothetical protein